MKLGYRSKRSVLFISVFSVISLILPGINSTDSESHNSSNLQPFLDTVSVFKNDLGVDNADELDSEFNLNSEDKVKLNFDSKVNSQKDGFNFEQFKNATELYSKDDWKLSNNESSEKIEDLVESSEVSSDRYGDKPESAYSSEDVSLNDIIVVDPKGNLDEEKREVKTEDLKTEEREIKESVEFEGSRRVLTLNLEPEEPEESTEIDLEDDAIKNKIAQMISRLRKLKTEVIRKNSEIEIIFNEVAQMRVLVSKMENESYHELFKELERLSKDLNLLRKGNIFAGYSDNILGNITVMEAFHGLYIIYRTPFILMRHKSKLYARFEKYLYELFKKEIPNVTKSLLLRFKKHFKKVMNYAYGNTLKFTRATYIHHNVTKKTLVIYDTLLADYIKFKFQVDVTDLNCTSKNKFVSMAVSLLTKFKFVKHYKYIKHSVLNNSMIMASFLNRKYIPSSESNSDLLYVKHKDHKMLEVLCQIYRLKLLKLFQRCALQSLRYTALTLNLFVKDRENSVNMYTRPLFHLREDSLFKFRNMYVLLRSASIYALQKVDVFMDYCFNYANKLNPELSILLPKDLSNRIFFVSIMILLTFVIIFVAQLFLQGVFSILTSPFSTRSKSSAHSRFRHWYHRSYVRQLAHFIKKNFSSHGRSHRKKHKYHRNFESFHRIIDDSNVTNSDNYKQFKSTNKSN